AAIGIPVLDLGGLGERERTLEARRLAAAEAARPFDLLRGPLARIQFLRLSAREHIGYFTFHHIISDGWSMGILVQEIAALYRAYLGGRPSPLAALASQVAYGKVELIGAPSALELPTDRPYPPLQSSR